MVGRFCGMSLLFAQCARLQVSLSGRSDQRSNIIRYHRKSRRGSISSARTYSQASLWAVLHMPEGSWKGDLFVADEDELQENDASEVKKVRVKKKGSCAERRRHLKFPSEKLAEKGSEVRSSRRKKDEPNSSEQQREQDDLEAKLDF